MVQMQKRHSSMRFQRQIGGKSNPDSNLLDFNEEADWPCTLRNTSLKLHTRKSNPAELTSRTFVAVTTQCIKDQALDSHTSLGTRFL
jgi:hypothetical protein